MCKSFVLAAASLSLALVSASAGQIIQQPAPGANPRQAQQRPSVSQDVNPGDDPSGSRERMQEQATKSRNSERQKRLEADTAKLLSLATELKSDVDKSTKDTLSIQVIQKAAEIERLAHDVKERMKG